MRLVNASREAGRVALALVGPGRAGTTVAAALAGPGLAGGRGRRPSAGRGRARGPRPQRFGAPAVAVEDAARDADLVIVATPDAAIESVAAQLAPGASRPTRSSSTSRARAGSRRSRRCRAASARCTRCRRFPTVEAGLSRLPGSWCAIAGDPAGRGARRAARAAAGRGRRRRSGPLPRRGRASPRTISSRCSARSSACHRCRSRPSCRWCGPRVDNVADLGAAAALTGPVSRGDVETVRAHLDALPADERDTYRALARAAYALAGRGRGAGDAELAAVLR